ncbi:MAG: PepSY-like domain-containing protein [Chitinophagales bacterium]|nr:PepSY-like domain-containing protein [Chitinophagales bacterium]MCO5281222.1 PepSY-like domain-containing protein [Chitinophagales bacterium]OJV25528.1 MAG: hypothetical protein BGO32_00510 [Bacteroidetes bacterium 37-13]HRN94437.1 PepSY-like domain-containing protein [Chitinophagales bacterium]HRP38117.1 PepSY-like domain-containing protein [Chitinophagales bacterium]
MKKSILTTAFALFLLAGSAFSQDILQSQVPSLTLNKFQQSFPKASNVEWELKGDLYKVEFEIGLLGVDHSVWYDKAGTMVKHKEEISSTDLPKSVLAAINKDYKGFRISDVKKISEGNTVSYTLDLKSFTQEWKMAYDSNGKLLQKIAD